MEEKMRNIFAKSGKKERIALFIIAGIFLLAVLVSVKRVVAGSLDPAMGESYRVIDILQQYQNAAIVYYTDWNEWPSAEGDWKQSLDHYMENPHLGDGLVEDVLILKNEKSLGGYIGFRASEGSSLENPAVQSILKGIAAELPLYMSTNKPYSRGMEIYADITGPSIFEFKRNAALSKRTFAPAEPDAFNEDAYRVLNLLNQYKSAAFMYYADWNEWPSAEGDWKKSLDHYVENPHLGDGLIANIRILNSTISQDEYIGFTALDESPLADAKVQESLKEVADQSALFADGGKTPYQMGPEIYVSIKGKSPLENINPIEEPIPLKKETAPSKIDSMKIIKSLRGYKAAAIMYYTDWNEWPSPNGSWEKSLDEYMEVSFDTKEYTQLIILDNTTLNRRLIGLEGAPDSPLVESSVQEQLKRQAINSGLFDANGDVYVSGNAVYLLMK